MRTSRLFLALVAGASLCAATVARADDACLVGTWRPVGNGAAEWMQRNMPPGMHINVPDKTGYMRLRADGTYEAGATLDARATIPNGASAKTQGAAHSAGQWRIADGQLIVTPQSEGVAGTMTVTLPDGKHVTRPLPGSGGGGATAFGYSCAADTLVTRKSFPGMADPLTQRYERVSK